MHYVDSVELDNAAEHKEGDVKEQSSHVGGLAWVGRSRLPVGFVKANQLCGESSQLARSCCGI